jgi:hypothetical protein
MADISESYVSRPFTLGRNAARELIFDIHGTDDEAVVKSLLLATAPATYQGLLIESVEAEPEGNGNWKGHARYIRLVSNDEYTFETGGGTEKVTQSLGTTIYPGAFGSAPDFAGAIGVDGDKVEGVDITSPAFEFSETHYFLPGGVDQAYKLICFNLTGKINNATFKGFASGECKFMGASRSQRGDEQWGITYRFACSPNATGLTVGGITGITKQGWEYLWVRYEDFEDSSAFALVKRPTAVYVEVVSEYGDFSLLNIGV